jgi:hypothetical protein
MYSYKFIMEVYSMGFYVRTESQEIEAHSREHASSKAGDILIKRNSSSVQEKYEWKDLQRISELH